ncbi:hypothetical protein CAEBREN_26139 [Caenorhabditis brenneri]|uniref:Signal recognition particle 14 kDa protein n=1 Tax=Caenorhabditis brenneri TaxID=135651 RepID=G0PGJ7_CAEBE|nr:hypothetical protein CAEBREN_24751 [Caenorhabditis brenneri]EGT55175.1 hypothetical protein CAEBREN_26139 [Caenorhabditis brenneri]
MSVEQHIPNDQFLQKLTAFYRDSKIRGPKSVYVTMKPYDGRTKAMPKGTGFKEDDEISCIFRAKWGSKKIATEVKAKEVNNFHSQYSAIIIAQMVNLEKRKKTDDDKKKSTGAAKA